MKPATNDNKEMEIFSSTVNAGAAVEQETGGELGPSRTWDYLNILIFVREECACCVPCAV